MFDADATATLQRVRGEVRVAVDHRSGVSRLRDLYQTGSSKVLLPNTFGAPPEAVLINTAGGLTGGDRVSYKAEAGDQSTLTMTTQTAERLYRSEGAAALQETSLQVGSGAMLEWLPQETIIFERAHLRRSLTAELAHDARFLALESVVLGRAAMGESPEAFELWDRWRVNRGGQLVFADNLALTPPLPRCAATLGHTRAFATLLYVAPDAEARLDELRMMLPDTGAASAWNGFITARFLAEDPTALRSALMRILTEFRGRDLPRPWTM
jgi:urease accessory protein